MFQFLIGSMKVVNQIPLIHHDLIVSIPYRFNERGILWCCPLTWLHVSIPYRFNERNIAESFSVYFFSFQFLIGSMKEYRWCKQNGNVWVSIPYRFNESANKLKLKTVPYLFQFLIGSMKALPICVIINVWICFNSL